MGGADEPLRPVVEARLRGRARQELDERPRKPGHPADARREQVGRVRVVAAEELVAPLARERDLHVLGREPRDEVRRQSGRVREGLVERVRQGGQEQRCVGPQDELAVACPVPLDDEPRVRQLIEGPLLEADREGAQRLGRLLRRECGECRRVDPAREEHTDGHVADEVRAHRVAQARAQLLGELGVFLAPHLVRGHRRRPRETPQRHLARLPGKHVPGRKLAALPEDRQRRRDRVEGEERLERVEVDLAARERSQLGREFEATVGLAHVERLDPEAVARKHEPPPAPVPERDREHPAQPAREVVAVLLVQVDEHLGVAAGAEAMTGRLELSPQLPVVVDLPVLDDVDGAVLVRDRLVAALEVDDREPAGREADTALDERPVGVGAAVDKRGAHLREPRGVDGAARGRDSADPAHGVLL